MEEKTQNQLLEEIYNKHIKEYSEFIKISFQDLVSLSRNEKDVFLDLYYNRDTETNEMKSILKNVRNRGNNILIMGDAGSGKSSFMYKVFYEIELLTDYQLYPIIVDYQESVDIDHLFKTFIDNMITYFNVMERPCNQTKDNTNENITHNIHLLKTHLATQKTTDLVKHLVILLDDFDYVEQHHLFDLLELFMGFGVHPNATLVLAVRPPLFTAINEYDNRFAKNFTRDVHKIELSRLDVKRLISKRLAIILIENQKKHGLTKWWERISGKESPYLKLLKKMGIENIEDLNKISIPFTDLYLNFIRCITDSNIREIFEIVHDSLIYVLSNYNKLDTVIELDDLEHVEKKEIPMEAAMKLFYDNENATFKIININKYRARKTNNSLFYNTMEGVKLYGELHETFYEAMTRLGHSKKDVDWAITKLKSPEYKLISASKIIPSSVKTKVDKYPEYKISKKGDYYLTNLCYWKEFISRCGPFGTSLSEIIKK